VRKNLGVIIVGVGVAVFGVYSMKKNSARAHEADRAIHLSSIQKEYLERVAWIRSNPDEKSYRDEVDTFFRWYFKELNDHHHRFGGNREFDTYLRRLEERGVSGEAWKEKEKNFKYVKSYFDQFKSGNYEPVFTATDKGMRFEIISSDVVMEAGQPVIRFPVVLWGAPRQLKEEGRGLKRVATSASFDIMWKLFDEKGKLYGEMPVTGDPTLRVDYPETFIEEFPPQMLFGHYDMELLPSAVAKVEITFNVTSRSPSGGELKASYTWALDTPREWKLREGEAWRGAQEDIRPDDSGPPTADRR
jgi:hypothetical protein